MGHKDFSTRIKHRWTLQHKCFKLFGFFCFLILAASDKGKKAKLLLKLNNVPVKSKLKHPPPRAYPGHLTSFPAREGGNLINVVFPGAGHLTTTHRGWGI